MFYYLLSPENQAPTLIGLTVINDTVTGYVTFYGYTFQQCITEYAETVPVRPVYFNDKDHSDYHSKNAKESADEVEIMHTHLKHQKTVTPLQLNRFLKKIGSCHELEFKPEYPFPIPGKPFLNKRIRKDIIKKFVDYQKNNYTKYIASNNPIYNSEKKIPTLGKHAACIREGLINGCNVKNNFSSALIPPSDSYGAYALTVYNPKNTEFNSPQKLDCMGAGTGLLVYTLFNCLRKSKIQTNQNNYIPSLKRNF